MLALNLVSIPALKVRGIYKNKSGNLELPERMRFLHPEAADSFYGFFDYAVVSDMFRSPESSLAAVRAGRGAMPPGFSGHNYGLSIDLDVKETMRRWGAATKATLDGAMEDRGWFCHRVDHKIDREAWHYNFLGVGRTIIIKPSPRVTLKTTSGYIEARIQKLYGDQLQISDEDAQRCLKKLGLYSGEIDGQLGPISKEAIRIFQRGWGLPETGKLDGKTPRTLAYVGADRRVDGKFA